MGSKLLAILFCILLVQIVSSDSEITVIEEDFVNLSVVSKDPDDDRLFITFTEPVNNKGLWQTKIGDAGEYYVNVTITDKKLEDSQILKINVLPKTFHPNITYYSPDDLNISIKELYSIYFDAGVEDIDSSKLYLSWKVDGKNASSNLSFKYDTNHYSAGHHTVSFTVSDGDLYDQVLWNIYVEDANAPPVLDEIKDLTFTEGDLVNITPTASDIDNDYIKYTISKPIGDDGLWQTDFEDEGVYDIEITASDGRLTDSKTVKLTVKKNDRAPVIVKFSPEKDRIYAKEGEELSFSLRAADLDKEDEITYSWTVDDIEVGTKKAIDYFIDYNSAGIKRVKCTVSDGIIKVSREWVLVIEDINQPPILYVEDSYIFDEGDLVKIDPNASDYENDEIVFSFSLPLDENGEWQTDHKSSGVYAVNVSAHDGELADSRFIKIIVNNVDQPPFFGNMTSIYADEGDNLSIRIYAYDPDGEDITISAENLPEGSQLKDNTLNWHIDYNTIKRDTRWFGRLLENLRIYEMIFSNSKRFRIKFSAEAGGSFAVENLDIVVFDKNRVPIIEAPDRIYAKENELVKINYSYYDLDGDNLISKVSAPFNKEGVWQTDFEDSGKYNISIKVSDSLNYTEKNISVYVEDKNREPFLIIDDHITVTAGEEVVLDPEVVDLDRDNISIIYSGWMESDTYWTNENESGVYVVTVSVTDGINSLTKDITVEVKQQGILWFYLKFVLLGLLLLAVIIFLISRIEKKRDKKEEEKIYEVEEEVKEAKQEIISKKETKDAYEEEPEKEIIKTFNIKFKWIFAFLILFFIITACVIGTMFLLKDDGSVKFNNIRDKNINENELIKIDFNTKNTEGIEVYNLPEGSRFENTTLFWTPGFEQAGEYNITAIAYNNNSNISQEFTIVVENTNRAPNITHISPVSGISVYTNKKIPFKVIAEDEDNEELTYTWYFGFDSYKGKEDMIRTFTIPGKKTVKVKVCDKEECDSYKWKLKAVSAPKKQSPAKTYVIVEDDFEDEPITSKDNKKGDTNTYIIYDEEKVEVIGTAKEDGSYNINTYVIGEEAQLIGKEDDGIYTVYG